MDPLGQALIPILGGEGEVVSDVLPTRQAGRSSSLFVVLGGGAEGSAGEQGCVQV